MSTHTGRGAWNQQGVGGTLKRRVVDGKTVALPGPYYLHTEGDQRISVKVARQISDGVTPDRNDYAVFQATRSIQRLLGFPPTARDGIIGPKTDAAIRSKQWALGLTDDGVIGPTTMRTLLMPLVAEAADYRKVSRAVVCGILTYEGGWDPGAIGYVDNNDVGLAQISLKAHPRVTFEAALSPWFSVGFAAQLFKDNMTALSNNERDSIAAYNLGVGGARSWIRAGRPDSWQPAGSTSPRNVRAYIDRILSACR